jgi:hypothetical protein
MLPPASQISSVTTSVACAMMSNAPTELYFVLRFSDPVALLMEDVPDGSVGMPVA